MRNIALYSVYPNPKHLFGIGILIWAAKNLRFSHRVFVFHVPTLYYRHLQNFSPSGITEYHQVAAQKSLLLINIQGKKTLNSEISSLLSLMI